MKSVSNILNKNVQVLHQTVAPLQKFFNNFTSLRFNNQKYTNDEIISRTINIINHSKNYIKYPHIELSHNWLILSSQLSTLANAVVNQMWNLYTDATNQTISQLKLLDDSQNPHKR